MNSGIYRLVFNEARACWVAVGEHVRTRRPGRGGRRARLAARASALLLFAVVPAQAGPTADALPNVSVKVGPNTSIAAPVVNPVNSAGRLLNINQGDRKAILQGPSFDIGRASEVKINYGNTGSATLVRVTGGKTTIEGALTAPGGDIYLLNQNGILFADGARVNVHGLVASALDLEDSDFLNDLGHLYSITDGNRPAYVWKGDAEGFATALVQVEPDARIKAQLGGSVMLFAPKVINQGSIETNEGQVAMAAGGKVYLSFAPDPNAVENPVAFYSYAPDSPYRALAGVLVEVDPYTYQTTSTDGNGNPVAENREMTGQVVNDTMGRILAQRGNVTMSSFLVNQNGRVTATTSVNQKGSIRLLARDKFSYASTNAYDENGATQPQTVISATRTGTLSFGENSVTEILPEGGAGQALARQHLAVPQAGEPIPQNDESSYLDSVLAALQERGLTATDEQTFNPPTIEAVGKQVSVLDGARIVAPGGHISISAQASGIAFDNTLTEAASGTRLYLGENSLIDASGLKGVDVSLDRNFIEVLLTLNDLRDNPLNKNGFLYRKKVWFDIRDLPDSQVADLSGYLKQVPRSISEKLATAGSVKLQSEGDIVQRIGSRIDVSGGTLNYSGGTHKETWVIAADGKAYNIGSAPAGTIFTGFLGDRKDTAETENYLLTQEDGYVEGKAAGTLSINAFGLAMDGSVSGGATYGIHQRESDNLGGTLIMGDASQSGRDAVYKLPDVSFVGTKASLAASFGPDTALPADRLNTVMLDAGMINHSGFEDVRVYSDGRILVDAPLAMPEGGKLSLTGRKIEVRDHISARGGAIILTSQLSRGSTDYSSTGVSVTNGATLDVSGLWINNYLTGGYGTGRVITKGGKIVLHSASTLTLDSGGLLDVSGGAWLKSKSSLKAGNAGSIELVTNAGQQIGEYLYQSPTLLSELRGYSLAHGGSLSITAPFVTIGGGAASDAREFMANASFFQRGGFADYSLTGRDGVHVRSDALINVIAQNYQLLTNYLNQPTGVRLHDFATVSTLPAYLRYATSLSFSTQSSAASSFGNLARGSILVDTGAWLRVDGNGIGSNAAASGGRIALTAWSNLLEVNGTLEAKGGEIALTMAGDPTRADDEGYSETQAIWLGSNSRLVAQGEAVYGPMVNGLREVTVRDGGEVRIDADKGYVVAETGSVIDVSGVSGTVNKLQYVGGIPRYVSTTVPGDAGRVVIDAREGMLVDATFKASSPSGLGGTLDLGFGRGPNLSIGNVSADYPGTTLNDPSQRWFVSVTQDNGFIPASLEAGDNLEALAPGAARISADGISAGGFADLVLGAEYGVRFEGNVTLSLARSLGLDARVVEATGDVQLKAPYVALSNIDTTLRPKGQFTAPSPILGDGTLDVTAQMLEFKGHTALSGVSKTSFTSIGDIRMTGFSETTSAPTGSLRGAGDMEFTARQLYPTTLSDFTISAESAGSKVSFHGQGQDTPVWSAGGKLTVKAATIEQGGVLKAPFGIISLEALDKLILKDGSLTSVSAEGATIPFGYTSRDGLDYLYDFGTGTVSLTTLPERVIKLTSPVVDQAEGSVVDISGSGDLYAYEWVPGIGGSTDVLAQGANLDALGAGTLGAWAILPANNQTIASYDAQYWQGSDIKPGDAVYLSGVPGLTAGYYTLLPARYALLPGAMLVNLVEGYQDYAGQAIPRVDGTYIAGGHLAAYTGAGYKQTGRTAGFVVRSSSDVRKLAEYQDTLASERFAGNAKSRQTGDAGRYSIAASTSLALNGIVRAAHASSASGAEVDIAAPKLMVVAEGTMGEAGYLAIDESQLAAMNVASLLLGGTRSGTADGSDRVDVLASDVRLGTGATIQGPEVILAATDQVRLESGSEVKGEGSGEGTRDLIIGSTTVDGDGALLRVSGGSEVELTRVSTDRNRGDLIVENGAIVEAGGSMLLDATRKMDIDSPLQIKQGAALAIAAGRISLGEPEVGAGVTDGLWLTSSGFDALENAASLTLRSYTTLDVYSGGEFGASSMDLRVHSAGISGYQNDGETVTILASRLTLDNAGQATFAPASALSDDSMPALGSGNLVLSADTVATGDGDFKLAGFDQSTLDASSEIVAQGTGKLAAEGGLSLSATRITALSGANQTFETTGALKTASSGAAATSNTISAGSTLAFRGDSVLHQGIIDAAGGAITLEATGADSTDHVTLAAGSKIIAKGSTFTLHDQSTALPAGSVALISKSGSVKQEAAADIRDAALIDVSAAPGGDAGTLKIKAVNGNAVLAGDILAENPANASGDRGNGAEVEVDVGAVADAGESGSLSQTIAALQDFSGAQTYRVRTGDVIIAASDRIETGRFVMSADTGKVDVAGAIDASGAKGGSIEIYAKNDLTLQRGSALLARGEGDIESTAGTLGRGGSVTLSSDEGAVKAEVFAADGTTRLVDAALIDVAGDQIGEVKGEAGKVILRADRTGLNDIASNAVFNPVTTAGTGAAYTMTIGGFSLVSGAVIAFKPNVNSTSGTSTLNISGTGAKAIKKNGGANLAVGDLKSGQTYLAVYDGTNFQLVSSSNLANGSDAVGMGVKVDAELPGAITGAGEVLVEAVRVYEKNAIDAAYQKQLAADTVAFASRSASILAGFAETRDGVAATMTPGVEVRASSGNLTLNANSDWNLGNTATGAIPMTGGGILTLRAAGDLDLKSSIDYEQYTVVSNNPIQRTGSWSYRLAAGSDMAAVNPEAVREGSGDLKISTNNKFVRTGTGFIHGAAGKDISLNTGAAVYTEGMPDASRPQAFESLVPNFTIHRELYPDGGGDVRLSAGGKVSAGASDAQTVNEWLNRASLRPTNTLLSNEQLRWWARFDQVRNLVGALGGGDVSIRAGGDVQNLQVVASGNGRVGGDKNLPANMANLSELGGGDVDVRSGGNVSNALLFASKGEARARVDGDFSGQFALMDGQAHVTATGDVSVERVFNPTATLGASNNNNSDVRSTYFYSYGEDSGIEAVSVAGDVNLSSDVVYPAVLEAVAPAGDVVTSQFTLYPSASGNATLLAGNDVEVRLSLSEIDPSSLPRVSSKPVHHTDNLPKLAGYIGSAAHTPGLLHAGDIEPVKIYAGHDVEFEPFKTVALPKAVNIRAGNDVVDPNLVIQNQHPTDVSLIQAAGNIRYTEPVPNADGSVPATIAGIQVAGPGRLHLISGKDIDLGSSQGIRSVGNLYNPYLTEEGADILVNPGAVELPDYAAMIAAYIDPASAGIFSQAYLLQLAEYMRNRIGDPELSEADALSRFKALEPHQQAEFVNTVFFSELRASGREAIDSDSASFGDYSRAQRAILRMFPGFTVNQSLLAQSGSLMSDFGNIRNEQVINPGDLKLFYSQIRSERGGRVELLVPGGFINAGLAVAGELKKPETDLGIVSVRGGDVLAMVRGDFQVNQSRVFTLGGSDLMLFSALEDIDAGRGAKTASATPPPVLRVKDGQVFYDYSGAVSGSGIAALIATGGEAGTVDLFAPYGEINAGEAGIRSAGNINLGARVIVGADNISAGGVTTGVPTADTSGLSLSVGGISDPAAATKSGDALAQAQSGTQNSAARDNWMPSFISVEVIGLGSEDQEEKKKKDNRL